MLKPSLCYYSEAYIIVNGRIINAGAGDNAAARQVDRRNEGLTFKNCAPFFN